MPLEEDLPNLFAQLPNLVVAGYGNPVDMATIYSTGRLPQPELPTPTLADLEEEFQREQGDMFVDTLRATGDPGLAHIVAGSQAQDAIKAAIDQTIINNH